MVLVNILVMCFYGYLAIGFVFALWFVFKGVRKIDHGMESVSIWLRLMLIPGSALLWIFLLIKYLSHSGNSKSELT